MALDIGALTGYLELNPSDFDTGLSGALGKLRDFGGKGAKIAAVAGVAVATAFAGSVVANMSVEAGNDKLSAQLGLTESESARVGQVAGKLYADAYGGSLEDVNGAVGAVMSSIEGMGNASGRRLEKVTAKALDFATAFDIDVARAAQVAGQAVQTGLADNATQAFDLITAASQRVPVALREDILDAVDEYGPSFAQLGYSGEQAFAMLVDASEKGMYGIDKTGDAVKEFALLVSTDLKRTKPVIKSLGLDYGERAEGLLAGGEKGADATGKIIDGLLKMKDPTKQARAAVELFGTPIEDLNTKDIPKFLKSMRGGSDAMAGFGGAAERMGDTLNDNAKSALTSIKRQAELLFISFSNRALPAVTALAVFMADSFGPSVSAVADILSTSVVPAVMSVVQWLGKHETTAKVLAGVITGVVVPALTAWAVAATVAKVKVVASWLKMRGAAVKAAVVHSGAVVKMIAKWALLGVKSLLHAAKVAAAWFIALGPVGWVIATVIGLVAVVIANWDKVKRYTGAAWDWIVSKLRSAWDWVKRVTTEKGGQLLSWFRDLPGKIVDSLSGLPGKMAAAGVSVVTGIWDGIQSMGSWLFGKVTGFISDNLPGPVKKALGISSPSRLMRDLARWVPEGLALGIEDGLPRVRGASVSMAKATTPDLDDLHFRRPPRGGGGEGGGPVIKQYFPTTATPAAASAAAGGRVLAALAAMGV